MLNLSYLAMVIALLVLVADLVADDRRKGRVRAPYPVALAAFAPRHRVADWYGSL